MPTEDATRIRALAAVIRAPGGPDDLDADADGFLRALGVSESDRRKMLSCGKTRLLAYQSLVHNTMRKTLGEFFPRCQARIGKEAMAAWARRFITEAPPKTAYLRDVPDEFLAWAKARWAEAQDVPDWLHDLARYEFSEHASRNHPAEVGKPTDKALDLAAPVACNGTLRVLRFEWQVYRLPRAAEDRSEPAAETSADALLVYRGKDEGPKERTIKARSALLVEKLIAGQALQRALMSACAEQGVALDDEVLKTTAVTLAELLDAGILLGGL